MMQKILQRNSSTTKSKTRRCLLSITDTKNVAEGLSEITTYFGVEVLCSAIFSPGHKDQMLLKSPRPP